MKHYILFLVAFYIITMQGLFAQNNMLSELEGLRDHNGKEYYEWAGYNIFLEKVKTPTKEKEFKKLIKRYDIKNIANEYSDQSISYPHKIISSVEDLNRGGKTFPDIKHHRILYIINKDAQSKTSDILLLQRTGDRDIDIENQILKLSLTEELSSYLIPRIVDSINFAGRTLHLGNLCDWRSPHNINCSGGQLSWSIYDSFNQANSDINNYIKSSTPNNYVILENSEIPLLFEGIQTTAKRIVYKSIDNDNYPLIVYYIASELRGKYISCILSHYGHNKDDYQIPNLLQEIIEFEDMPEVAWNKYSVPERDTLSTNVKSIIKEKRLLNPAFSIKSGIYIPLGNQRDILGNSPFIDVEMNLGGLYGFQNGGLLVNFGFIIPNDRKWFDFKNNDETIRAKAHNRAYANVGYKYAREISRFLYWDNFLKLGVNSTFTNKKKPEKNDDGTHSNYSAAVFNMSIGTQIRYKRVGLHLEYQYAPYNQSKYLDVGGHSAILTGLSFSF